MQKPNSSYRLLFWLIPLLVVLVMLIYIVVFFVNFSHAWRHLDQPAPVAPVVVQPVAPAPTVAALPPSTLLNVPFTAQAPLANWDALHEEACEEASLMMVKYYFHGQVFGSPEQVDQEIQALVSWETDHGYSVDLTASELVAVARDYYNFSTGRVLSNPTVDDIKQELAKGNLVVVPAAGRLLPNPNFTPPGPVYHMLVIKGYTDTEFITNDPGTRHGNSFAYPYQALLDANHSWNPTDILQGEKQMVVFSAG